MAVKRKKRTPEQIAATNAKRAATIAAKRAKVETPQTVEAKEVDVPSAKVAEPETTAPEATPQDKPLPKALADRIQAQSELQTELAEEVEKFKTGQAYLPGDIPITLHGLGGPGYSHGQRALNYIDTRWLDPLKHYRWSHRDMVDFHRADGYTPVDHVEFSKVVIARGGGHSFDKNATGHVFSGDLILIEISKDRHDQLLKYTADKTRAKEGRAKNNVYAKGEKLGVDVYEGGDAMSPRMENLMRFLEKELGPGAREAFLGGA